MRKIKILLIVMLFFISILFSLENFPWNGSVALLNIHAFVYLLMVIGFVIIFLIPNIQQFSVFVFFFFGSIAYFALRIFVFNDQPILSEQTILATLTEYILLLTGLYLAYEITTQIRRLENFVEEVYLPNHEQRIMKVQAAKEEINTEFIRSRRHQHPLSLLVVRPETKLTEAELKKATQEIQKHMISRFVSVSLAKIISREARRTDLIVSQSESDHRFLILCPETRGTDTINLAERIRSTVMDRLGININYGIASFPEEALTYEELLQRAEFQLYLNKEGPQEIIQSVPAIQSGEIKKINV